MVRFPLARQLLTPFVMHTASTRNRSPLRAHLVLATVIGALACQPADEDLIAQPAGPEGGASSSTSGIDLEAMLAARPVKPNVMLLVDRSGSMAERLDCGADDCASKWDELLGLDVFLAEGKRLARLGLSFFPAPGTGCQVDGSVMVPLAEDDGVDGRILDAAARTYPGGRTPLAFALDEMRRNGGLDDPDRENILLVMTDGRPNCACAEGQSDCERAQAVEAVRALVEAPIPVDVDIIGFGASAREASETLQALAEAAGDDLYFQADTFEELVGSLYDVTVQNIPCRFLLDELPAPEDLVVLVDGEEVAACETTPCPEGYVYDRSEGTVELQGTACNGLRDGVEHRVWFESR